MYIVSTESLEYLLTCGCHADDHAGPTGATALHYAVTAAHGECVHILLNYGANVNAVVTSEEVRTCVCVCATQCFAVFVASEWTREFPLLLF